MCVAFQKKEMDKSKGCMCGCATVLIGVTLALCAALAIAALQIGSEYGHDQCIGEYRGISFGYAKWLYIHGWTEIAILTVLVILCACFGCCAFVSGDITAGCWTTVITIVLTIGYIFDFAWYIVGAILFFVEVAPTCPMGMPLYDFGLTLFIIKSVIIGCSLLKFKQDE